MDCQPSESCDQCKEQCERYSLYIKEQSFSYLMKDGHYQKLPLEEAAKHWIDSRKDGNNTFLIEVPAR